MRSKISKAADYLMELKKKSKLSEEDVLCRLNNLEIEFGSPGPDFDPTKTLWSILEQKKLHVHLPSHEHPANNVLYSMYLLSPRLEAYGSRPVLQQWILALDNTTIKDLFKAFKCPLCQISRLTAGNHCVPASIQLEDNQIHDFDNKFESTIGSIVYSLNTQCLITTEGGCCHTIVFNLAIAINCEPESKFPITIGGKGSIPPVCNKCKNYYGVNAFRCTPDDKLCFLCHDCLREHSIPNPEVCINISDCFIDYVS